LFLRKIGQSVNYLRFIRGLLNRKNKICRSANCDRKSCDHQHHDKGAYYDEPYEALSTIFFNVFSHKQNNRSFFFETIFCADFDPDSTF
jgi:hypothetical protein